MSDLMFFTTEEPLIKCKYVHRPSVIPKLMSTLLVYGLLSCIDYSMERAILSDGPILSIT